MKNTTKYLVILLLLIILAGCNSNNPKVENRLSTGHDSTEFISGKVNEIRQGKDGYTASFTLQR